MPNLLQGINGYIVLIMPNVAAFISLIGQLVRDFRKIGKSYVNSSKESYRATSYLSKSINTKFPLTVSC